MDHLTLKAVATQALDEGVFTAVISTESVDREKDVVSADAMVAALQKWNRPIPLAWNHSTAAEDIIGSVDPTSAKAVGGEVVVAGEVDLESARGQEAWRSFKSRTLGFSFGYLVSKSTDRPGGGKAITELDVFEVSATPTPMNNDTRVLSTKGTPGGNTVVSVGTSTNGTFTLPSPPDEAAAAEAGLTAIESLLKAETLSQETKDRLVAVAKAVAPAVEADEDKEPIRARSEDPLRKRSQELALEIQTSGLSLRKPEVVVPEPKPEPAFTEAELKRRSHDLMLEILTGTE